MTCSLTTSPELHASLRPRPVMARRAWPECAAWWFVSRRNNEVKKCEYHVEEWKISNVNKTTIQIFFGCVIFVRGGNKKKHRNWVRCLVPWWQQSSSPGKTRSKTIMPRTSLERFWWSLQDFTRMWVYWITWNCLEFGQNRTAFLKSVQSIYQKEGDTFTWLKYIETIISWCHTLWFLHVLAIFVTVFLRLPGVFGQRGLSLGTSFSTTSKSVFSGA